MHLRQIGGSARKTVTFAVPTGIMKLHPRILSWCLVLSVAVLVSWLQWNKGVHVYSTGEYTSVNNYIIFSSAFDHLIEGRDLYAPHPDKHHDLFKYSPAFALAMGFLAWMPVLPGFMFWNCLNALLLLWVWWKLPIPDRLKLPGVLLWLPELVISLQNAQSNGLMTAAIMGTWLMYENNKPLRAAGWLNAGVFIKLFGLVSAVFAVMYKPKLPIVGHALAVALLLVLVPVVVTGPDGLTEQYLSWWAMLRADAPGPLPLSVPGAAGLWSDGSMVMYGVQFAGLLFLLIPLMRHKMYSYRLYRLYMLSLVLMWVVLWNHKAESPTYIIAVAGAVVWICLKPANAIRVFLMILVVIFTSLSQSDLFPATWRTEFFQPYLIKMFPCLLVYGVAWAEAMVMKPSGSDLSEAYIQKTTGETFKSSATP